MTEEEREDILAEIFGEKPPAWNGYKLSYCGMCNCYSISCDKCRGSTCGGTWKTDCDCNNSMNEFYENAKHPMDYLTKEEQETIFKFRQLKKFSRSCFSAGKLEIDWKYLTEKGETCDNDSKIFPETNNYEYKPQYE